MGFFAMVASMLLGILFIALGIVFVLIAVYLGFPKLKSIKASLPSGRK